MAVHQALEQSSMGYVTPEAQIQDGIETAKMTVVTENAGQSPPVPGSQAVSGQMVLGKSIGLWVFIILLFVLSMALMPDRE